MQLTIQNWKVFAFTDIFVIKDGYYNKKPPHEPNGNIPFLGATQYDNGITAFYTLPTIRKYDKVGTTIMKDKERRMFKGNCIAITNNGSVGNAYYQIADFTCSHDITPIYLKGHTLNRYIALFLIPLIMKSGESFEYAKKWRPKRMRKSQILLPATADGTPDWQFMEDYMRQTEQQILQPTIERLCKHLIFSELQLTEGGGGGKNLHSNWKEFTIGDFFNATRPTARKEDDYANGDTMFVASGGINNGVTKFCKPKDNEILDKGNCLTVSPVDGSCYYQATDFLGRGGAGSSVILLYAKKFTLNRFNGLFISRCISKTTSAKYSYGHMASIERIMRDKILLPATNEGKPDFVFMSSFMQQVEQDIIRTTLPILQSRLKSSNSCWGGGVKLDNQNWKDFCFTDIFTEIQRGKRLKRADHKNGNMPYISSRAQDNGVDGFVGNEGGVRLFGDCLTLANSGSVGSAFYHRYKFVASDHVTRLKNDSLNKYIYLFMIPLINRLSEKYSFNREINDERLKRERLFLPVTSDGTPDWLFMEDYMRNLESYQIALYLSDKVGLYNITQKKWGNK